MYTINEEYVTPYFQPILSVDTFSVFGYEVLGRLVENGTVKSLGPFFCDETVPFEETRRIDRIIREKAFAEYIRSSCDKYLFINIKPAWIYEYVNNPEDLPSIRLMREYGIDPRRVVIEITEDDLLGNIDLFSSVLRYYKQVGCRLAIDDFGKSSSNFERIAYARPDILKIDKSIVQTAEHSENYQDVLIAINQFAETLGIEVLFECVENVDQLRPCIAAKGRYYQGFLFSEAVPTLSDNSYHADLILNSVLLLANNEQRAAQKRAEILAELDECVGRFFEMLPPFTESPSENLQYLLKLLPRYCTKLYICNKSGRQVSYNIEVDEGSMVHTRDYRNRNWLARSYFSDALCELCQNRRSMITKSYRDITSKERTYSYICLFDDAHFLFIDITEKLI